MQQEFKTTANISSSSLDSFHSALSNPENDSNPQKAVPDQQPILTNAKSSLSSSPQPLPQTDNSIHLYTLNNTPVKQSTSRARWLFGSKEKSPQLAPHSSPPSSAITSNAFKLAQKRPRIRRSKHDNDSVDTRSSSHPFHRNVSDKSSLASSAEDKRINSIPRIRSPQHMSIPNTDENNTVVYPHTNVNSASASFTTLPHSTTLRELPNQDQNLSPSISIQPEQVEPFDDNWGLDDLSDTDTDFDINRNGLHIQTTASVNTKQYHNSNTLLDSSTNKVESSFDTNRSLDVPTLATNLPQSLDPTSAFLGVNASANLATSSPSPSFRDTITLRAYDDKIHTGSGIANSGQLTSMNNLIGVYADPAAETDDWGDDFILESDSERPGDASTGSRTGDEGPSSFPSWLVDKDAKRTVEFGDVEVYDNISIGDGSSITAVRTAINPSAAEVVAHGDEALPIHSIPAAAFATPKLTHASLLKFPGIGYEMATVHPSCIRVKELFSRYSAKLRRHFDALVRDCGGTIAFDEKTRLLYLMCADRDVQRLAQSCTDLSADILMWKLAWVSMEGDRKERARILLALSDVYRDNGNVRDAISIIDEGLAELKKEEEYCCLSLSLATELEYMKSVLHRGLGELTAADKSLKEAMSYSNTLAQRTEDTEDLNAPQQRGLWWNLRCKFLQAEIAYDMKQLESAVQYYSEYVVESMTRMIGVISPPRSDDTTLGAEFMRYCLFSPRRLVLALWMTVLSLGELRCFGAAVDIASLTSVVASAFGYLDANNAVSSIRARIKEIGVEIRQQYDDISKTILQNDNNDIDELSGTNIENGVSASPFEYDGDDFGNDIDEEIEDWDAQLEKELNITIERCDIRQSTNPDGVSVNGHYHDISQPSQEVNRATASGIDPETNVDPSNPTTTKAGTGKAGAIQATSQKWAIGSQQGPLIEAELRNYLGRVTGAASALSARQMYPKPTQPFDGTLMGPREHETFLRHFIRGKDPIFTNRYAEDHINAGLWHPSAICRISFNTDSIQEINTSSNDKQVFSDKWSMTVLDTLWKIVRSDAPLKTKQFRVRRLVLHSFSKAAAASKKTSVHTDAEFRSRLHKVAAFIESLRIAREVVSQDGSDAAWFSRASSLLGQVAATVTPTAKSIVELFHAESRAHCGIRAIEPLNVLEQCTQLVQTSRRNGNSPFSAKTKGTSPNTQQQTMKPVPHHLRQSVVDVMHGLYWRTKAGFDESSDKRSLERFVHAEVTSSLYLTGSGISPVDGSKIDLSAEIDIFEAPLRNTENGDTKSLVDETRRVSASELVQELQSLWSTLPSSAGVVRAKVSFALAHHSEVNQKDYASAERFLFDGLYAIHGIRRTRSLPMSFFSRLISISPVAIVSRPLVSAILQSYGRIALSHSKYRYGIAALEAATDGLRARNMNKQQYRSSVMEVAEAAIDNNDWRRGLSLLHNLRSIMHPKDGLRNEFLFLCLSIHRVCFDAGCLDASIVPLRAYSALIYEERLRVLLQKYRRRLAKKSRSKLRRYLPGSPLPKLLPGGSVFANRRNSLASFFETPLPLVTAAIDTTIRQSMNAVNNKGRSSALATSQASAGGNVQLKKLAAYLWPVPVPLSRKSNKKAEDSYPRGNKSTTSQHPEPSEQTGRSPLPTSTSNKNPSNSQRYPDTEFEEEQRELLRIEAEQEATADYNRLQVELLRVQTEFSKGDYNAAEGRCRGLLDLSVSHEAKYQIWGILARIRLKRREITKCLEFVDKMEREYYSTKDSADSSDKIASQNFHEGQRLSLFRLHDSEKEIKQEGEKKLFIPQVTFLRVTALLHGGRLKEALSLADEALGLCCEHSFWNKGRLHYLRGKVLNAMSSTSTAPFQRESYMMNDSQEPTQLTLKVTELTIAAFEASSHYYSLAGDEICTAKADLLWARTCIDFLFRRVVLKRESGGGLSLHEACSLLDRKINLAHVIDAVYDVLSIASTANIPLLLIDSLAALAEVKCIQKQAPASWMLWVSEAWILFSRLFTDAEDFTVVLTKLAPVSTLLRLQNVCGRLVRLVMCNDQIVSIEDMNKHLRLFEAYVTLQISVDQKMNLASSAHPDNVSHDEKEHSNNAEEGNLKNDSNQTNPSSPVSGNSGNLKTGDSESENEKEEVKSENQTQTSTPHRPAGAFLHMLGSEGVALGRQGFSLFINRPRQQVISAVKGTGAVLIPSNFFSTSKSGPNSGPHELGKDAEMIFPFKPSLGLGAMQILDDNLGEDNWSPRSHPMSLQDFWTYSTATGFHPGGTLMSNPTALDIKESILTSVQEPSGREETSRRIQLTSENRDSVPHKTNSEFELRKSSSIPVGDSKREQASNRESEEDLGQGFAISNQNALATLLVAINEELELGHPVTKGSSPVFGGTTADRVWAHMHRIKTETKKYMHGEITMDQLHDRNNDALLGWIHCIPVSRKEWTVPESVGRRVVYSLYAHGVIGYYAVDRGGSIERVAFGGKQGLLRPLDVPTPKSQNPYSTNDGELRAPTEAEKLYLYELVSAFRKDEGWHKSRDSEIVHGMANSVLRAPRLILSAASPAQKTRSRPIVLIADFTLQVIPWELFFDHVVIRSHSLLDVIRELQEKDVTPLDEFFATEDPSRAANRKITRFICFGPSRREALDIERSEEPRRQQLAFQGLLRLNLMDPSSLIDFLDLGGFSAPTAINATRRPTGPLATSLSQSRKALKLLGWRIAPNIGKRNYPHMDFLRVSGLGSATTWDLKEAAMIVQPATNDKDEPTRDLGAYIPVFMFSYADLVDSTNAVFGLRRLVPKGILMFTPAIYMKVLARHLQDDELSAELMRASGRLHNRIFPDITASARVLVEYVSKFSREKRIPIVVFLGEGLLDVFTNNRFVRVKTERRDAPAADRLVQLSSTPTHIEYFRRAESMAN